MTDKQEENLKFLKSVTEWELTKSLSIKGRINIDILCVKQNKKP